LKGQEKAAPAADIGTLLAVCFVGWFFVPDFCDGHAIRTAIKFTPNNMYL
jgi:hypothetical protein